MAGTAADPENSRPTQTAPEQEIMVEDQSRSTWVSQVLEKQRCHFIHYLAHASGSASPSEGAGSGQPEEGELDDSILDALSPIPSDYSPMGSEEYEAACKALDEELGIVNQLPSPKEVLAIITEVDGGGSESEKTPSPAGVPETEAPGAALL